MRVMIHGKDTYRKSAAEADTRPAKRQRQDFFGFVSVPKLPMPQLEVKNDDISVSAKEVITKFKADHILGGFDPTLDINDPLLFWNSACAKKKYPELRIVTLRVLRFP